MWISKRKYDKILDEYNYKIHEFQQKFTQLNLQLDNLKQRVWKLENPPKFATFQEVMDGVIVSDLRLYNGNKYGLIVIRWEYQIIDKNKKQNFWISQNELEEKINKSNKKQTIKKKKS